MPVAITRSLNGAEHTRHLGSWKQIPVFSFAVSMLLHVDDSLHAAAACNEMRRFVT